MGEKNEIKMLIKHFSFSLYKKNEKRAHYNLSFQNRNPFTITTNKHERKWTINKPSIDFELFNQTNLLPQNLKP